METLLIWSSLFIFLAAGDGKADGTEFLRCFFVADLFFAASATDLNRKKVPNSLCLMAVFEWTLLISAEIWLYGLNRAAARAGESLWAAFFVLTVLSLLSYLMKGGLGMGDAKLLGTAALFLGGGKAFLIFVGGVLLAVPLCLFLIARKKEGRKKKLPLVPFFLAAVLLTGCGGKDSGMDAKPGEPQVQEQAGENGKDEEEKVPLSVTFFNVGKGDAILVEAGEETMLIDAGYDDTADTVLSYLKKQKIESLDYLVITHFDKDHVGGADRIAAAVEVKTVLQPDYESDSAQTVEYLAELQRQGLEPERVRETKKLTFGETECTVYPPRRQEYKEEDNDFSLVVSLRCGNESFLFAGDAEKERLSELLEEEELDLSHQVLKVPHHGRKEKNSEEFFRAVSPEAAVITCSEEEGADEKVLKILEEMGTEIFLTSEGTVTCRTDGKSLKFKQEE